MNRYILFTVLTAISMLVLQPAAVCAQGKTANLVGYEKAEYVSGLFSINPKGDSIALVGFKTVYDKPIEVYVTQSFDRAEAFKVGDVAQGKQGDMFFNIPALYLGGFDSVLLMVPEWSVPVGVGLLQ